MSNDKECKKKVFKYKFETPKCHITKKKSKITDYSQNTRHDKAASQQV